MSTPLDRVPKDLGVIFVPPGSPTDIRVPVAEEFTLAQEIQLASQRNGRTTKGWIKYPRIQAQDRTLIFSDGLALMPAAAEYQVDFDASIVLPALTGSGLLRQIQYVTLAYVTCEVGADQDPVLGQMTYQYLEGSVPNQTLETITKENTRRFRAFPLVIVSMAELTKSGFEALLTTGSNGAKYLQIANTGTSGFTSGGMQFYANPADWMQNASYRVFPALVEFLPICQVIRMRDYSEKGYTWGTGGEDSIDPEYMLIRESSLTNLGSLNDVLRRRLMQVLAGQPGAGKVYKRAVLNFAAGSVAGNPGREGVTASAPNGSTLLVNDQRQLFVNESRVQSLYCQRVTAANDGSGRPMVSVSLATQVPLGTTFSQNKVHHKIWTLDGKEQSQFGTWINLGGTGTLTWIGDSNASIAPNQAVIIQPGIQYPAGSGCDIPFEDVELAWLAGVQISSANIRKGGDNDLSAYAAPANNGNYILVVAPERSGVIYLYKKVQVTTDSNGVAVAPKDDMGVFAFLSGLSGRQDTPVVKGLSPNTTYDALIYQTFKSNETLQLQVRYCEYQGSKEQDFLNGSVVSSSPLFFAHTQGGGGSVFMGDAQIRYSPISMHLPGVTGGPKDYQMRGPVWLQGEQNSGPIRFREMSMLPGAGLAIPQPGQVLGVEDLAGTQSRSLTLKLTADSNPIGFRAPELVGKELYQCVMAFTVTKNGESRMVILTCVTTGGVDISADSSTNTAIDTFKL